MFGEQIPVKLEEAWMSFNKQPIAEKKKVVKKKREIKLELADTIVLDDADTAVNNATNQLQPNPKAKLKKKAKVEVRAQEQTQVVALAPTGPMEPIALLKTAPAEMTILTMEAHNRRDNQADLFENNITKYHTPTSEMLREPPPKTDPLQFAMQRPQQFPWAPALVHGIANNPFVGFPQAVTLVRAYIGTFLREPSPTMRYERPCINLDRLPLQHETLLQCAAHELSTKILGEGKGYKLRELLLKHEMTKIRDALDKRLIPTPDMLSEIPDMCFMCHLRHTYRLCLRQRNDEIRRKRTDLTNVDDAQPEATLHSIFNRFQVIIDVEGEYDRHACISYDDVTVGLSGPFPRWAPNNYEPCIVPGTKLRGFVELDKVVFHLARESQELEGCKTHGETACTPKLLTSRPSRVV